VPTSSPHYPLAGVKAKIKAGEFEIKPNGLDGASNDFGWGPEEIKKCLLKLNDKDHAADKQNNHYYKKEQHRHLPHTVIDYYKARNIMDGENVYIHLYIRNSDQKVIINSFHELEFYN